LYLSFLACRKAKIRFAVTPFYHYRLSSFEQSVSLRRMLPFCSAIIAVTEVERRELLKIGAPSERTFVVPLALEPSEFAGNGDSFRKKYGLEGKFVVLATAWVVKGALDVLQAVRNLSKKFSNLALVTFGDPDVEYLDALSSAKPLGFTAINLGWIYGQAKSDAFAGSDVLAMPSTADAFGMVYLELWDHGKPVIGAKNTAVEYIVKDGSDGFLVETHDVKDLEKQLERLVESPELASMMGQNGKHRVETEFTPAIMTKLFREALEKSSELGIPY